MSEYNELEDTYFGKIKVDNQAYFWIKSEGEQKISTENLVPGMKLHHLYDMSNDVAESEKIRRAESKLRNGGC